MDASTAAMALTSRHGPGDGDAGLAETIRRIDSELTLEAALAFVDGCSVDSDEECDAAAAPAPAPAPARKYNEHEVNALQRALDEPQPPPLSPRFFALMDTIEDESDSEYVSMEEALKMLDTREVGDANEQRRGKLKEHQPHSKTEVIVKESQEPKSFTDLVQGVSVAAATSGSSGSESSSDASARSGGAIIPEAASCSSKPAPVTRKPRNKAVSVTARQEQPKKKKTDGESQTANPAKKNSEVQADTSSSSTTTAPKPKKKRVRKQREELLYLREKVVEMQQVLEKLQKSGSTSSETASSSSTSSASSPTSSQQQESASVSVTENSYSSAAWDLLVEQQLQERQQAEQENRQLKAQLEGQIKLVRSFEKLLIGQNDIEISSSMSSHSKRPKMHFGNSLEDDSAIFRELKEELSSAYPRFEREFTTSYLKELTGDAGDIQVKKTVEQGMHVEFTACKVVQHSFEVTKKGLWRFISRDGMKSQCYFYHELKESTSDYIARDFGCKLERQYRDVNIHGKQVLKKVTQAHRDIFLWSAVVEPVKFSDAPTTKAVRFRERGWIVMHPVPPEKGSEKATIVKTFVTFTPDLDESVSATNLAVGAITDLVLDSVEGNIHFCQDIVDRLVLEEAQRSSANSSSSSSNLSIVV